MATIEKVSCPNRQEINSNKEVVKDFMPEIKNISGFFGGK
jgi:hypothetical protein